MKAVILAAGYGTRLLPVSRVVPKELLPLVDRPAIDLVVQELVGAGVDELVIVGSRRKRGVEDWFDHDPELFSALGDDPRIRPPAVRATFVRQARMGGVGDALLAARPFLGDEPFVLAYPDDLFVGANPTAQMLAVHQATGGCVMAAADGSGLDLTRYGVLDVDGVDPATGGLRVRGIVEKPPAGAAPSSWVTWGRYVLTPDLFPELAADAAAHRGGELYHIGALGRLAAKGRVYAAVLEADRRDTGTALGYTLAFLDEALSRPDLAGPVRAWLRARLRDG